MRAQMRLPSTQGQDFRTANTADNNARGAVKQHEGSNRSAASNDER